MDGRDEDDAEARLRAAEAHEGELLRALARLQRGDTVAAWVLRLRYVAARQQVRRARAAWFAAREHPG
jgi:hypothetical protein